MQQLITQKCKCNKHIFLSVKIIFCLTNWVTEPNYMLFIPATLNILSIFNRDYKMIIAGQNDEVNFYLY